jgi:hypothetical protein
MTHVWLEYHIKDKKSGGAFILSQQYIFMHLYSVVLDSDLSSVEGQKESWIRFKSQDSKHDLQQKF